MPDYALFCGNCGRRLSEPAVAVSPLRTQENAPLDALASTEEFLAAAAEAGTPPSPEPPGALQPMVLVPANRYTIGSPAAEGNPDEHPRHQVPLSAFYIDKYAVSNEQYERFDPNHRRLRQELGDGDRDPVVFVTYQDCLRYCRWRSEQEGLSPDAYSLPTEAQWEAAARGGRNDTIYPWGNEVSAAVCNTVESGRGRSVPVDQGTANGYGLVNIGGNVREWCRDVYADTFYSSREASRPDGTGPGEINIVNMRVVRGASFQDKAAELGRCAARNYAHPGNSYNDIGFRCVRKKD
jgi:formylglycine-generating enzyme